MIRRLLLSVSLFSMLFLAVPAGANAFDLFKQVDCGNAANSALCNEKKNNSNPLYGKDSLILKITNIVAFIAGAAAIIVIIVGAIRFVTAGSDTSKGGRVDADVEEARRTIASAVAGLVIIVLAKVIITYVVNKTQ